MTNETLESFLRSPLVIKRAKKSDSNCIFFANQRIHQGKYYGWYNLLVILNKEKKPAGVILDMSPNDIHIFVLKEFRGKHIVSNFLRMNNLLEFFPKLKSCSSIENENNEIIRHFASIIGIEFRNNLLQLK